jgi:hypothetical protein
MRKFLFIIIWAVVALLLAGFLSGLITFCIALLRVGDLTKHAVYIIVLASSTVLFLVAIALGVFGLLPGTRSQYSEHK